MTPNLILTILIIGLSGIVAQILILRELLVGFYGNELILGVILANWVVSEAWGAFLSGRFIDRARNKLKVLVIFNLAFCVLLPLSIYLCRVFKNFLGIPLGEAVGLYNIFLISFLIILPVSFCHGALFTLSCKISDSIGLAYAWETAGTLLGGVTLTYILIPYLNSFQIVFLISVLGLFISWFLCGKRIRILKYISILLILVAGYLILSGGLGRLQRLSINRQWQGQDVLEYRNSVYGNIVVTRKAEQYTFFYDGVPTLTVPYPDLTFVQEFGNLPLLFHRYPQDILVISGGAGGLINEILRHKVKRVDYAELDPLIIQMFKKYPSELIKKEFADNRVNVLNLDGRFFIRTTPNRYDIILIGLSSPSDLSTNRFFTQEFFSLVRKRLKPNGILGFCLPGSAIYMSRNLRDLNASILNGLKNTYPYIRVIPGDYNMYLTCDSADILEANADLITERIKERGIETNLLLRGYLEYRLDRKWLDWFEKSLINSTLKVNRDTAPFAVFQMLVIWNRQFSLRLANFFEFFENSNLGCAGIIILVFIFAVLLLWYHRSSFTKFSVAYGIGTSGFFGMLISLVLIFSFQVHYGYLYQRIGVLIAIFMSGVAAGSILISRKLTRIKNTLTVFLKFEVLMVIFTVAAALILNRPVTQAHYLFFLFCSLFFISGFILGLEFPLAGRIYLEKKAQVGETAGLLYFADLAGGWLAGVFGGILFLPILGVFDTCLLIAMVKISSLVLLFAAKGKFINKIDKCNKT